MVRLHWWELPIMEMSNWLISSFSMEQHWSKPKERPGRLLWSLRFNAIISMQLNPSFRKERILFTDLHVISCQLNMLCWMGFTQYLFICSKNCNLLLFHSLWNWDPQRCSPVLQRNTLSGMCTMKWWWKDSLEVCQLNKWEKSTCTKWERLSKTQCAILGKDGKCGLEGKSSSKTPHSYRDPSSQRNFNLKTDY